MAFHIKPRQCEYCNKPFKPEVFSQNHCSLFCRFWSKVNILGDNECWEWKASLNRYGYGQLTVNHRPVGAHRMAYEFTYGCLLPIIDVLHSCDNPPCCNPGHLFLGTQQINMQDREAKRRTKMGEDCSFAKLSEKDIVFIRKKIKTGMSQGQLAKEFQVCQTNIHKIIKNKTWKHIIA